MLLRPSSLLSTRRFLRTGIAPVEVVLIEDMFDHPIGRTAQFAGIGTHEALLVALLVLIIVHAHHLTWLQGNGHDDS